MLGMHKRWLCLWVLAALVVMLGACNNDNALNKTQKSVAETTGPKADTKAGSDKAAPEEAAPEAKVIPDTIYPELPMQLLNPKERAAVVKVTEAELCPCPGSSVSLHKCLQDATKRCPLAMQAGAISMQKTKEGLSEKDTLDEVGKYIQSAYKKYDFNTEGVPMKGTKGAPIVIVEFADFECPFCNLARQMIKPVLESNGQEVVFYFMHYPLSFHPNALSAAKAATAAQEQGRFWEMYDLVFDNQKILSDPKIENFAQEMGLNMDKFRKDWKSPEIAAKVEAQQKQGTDANVDSTPTFFINGRRFLGEKTPEGLSQAVKEAIAESKKKP